MVRHTSTILALVAFAILGSACEPAQMGNEPAAAPERESRPASDSEPEGRPASDSAHQIRIGSLDTKSSSLPRMWSCEGNCGGSALAGCWCDKDCLRYGDCCRDYKAQCEEPQRCGSPGDKPCAAGEFCLFPPEHQCGASDLGGSCQPRPRGCGKIYAPVCGCDGQTYANKCLAHSKGVSVEHEGKCSGDAVEVCGGMSESSCDSSSYCDFRPGEYCGAADSSSICRPRPTICANNFKPVCGCDGKTYSNSCLANAGGSGVNYVGECETPEEKVCGGDSGQSCGVDEYCEYEIASECGKSGPGRCEKRFKPCDKKLAPVCGCDGKSYTNRCMARLAGVSVESEGLCEQVVPKKCLNDGGCVAPQTCDLSVCLPCDAPDGKVCPAVCFGQCVDPKPVGKLCLHDSSCASGEYCNTDLCLSGCADKPGLVCPDVCYGRCQPAI